MALYAVTTTPILIAGPSKRAGYFELHALAANTDTIRLAGDVGSLANGDYEELTAGQSMSFENFTGSIYAASASGTQKLSIPWSNYKGQIER